MEIFFDGEQYTSKKFNIKLSDDLEDLSGLTIQKPDHSAWGIIIAIENYAILPPVDFAKRDGTIVKKYFINVLGIPEEQIITLIDSEATKSSIEGNIKNYLPKNLSKESTLYVYFAGHGSPDFEKQGETAGSDTYLVAYEGNPKFIINSSYKLKDFYKDLSSLDIKRSFVFLDACFSGTASRSSDKDKMLVAGARPIFMTVDNPMLLSDKVVSLSASKGGQVSNSYTEKKHGLFTYHLLKGMKEFSIKNHGDVKMEDLYKYVRENVSRDSRRIKGSVQEPDIAPDMNMIKNIDVVNNGTF